MDNLRDRWLYDILTIAIITVLVIFMGLHCDRLFLRGGFADIRSSLKTWMKSLTTLTLPRASENDLDLKARAYVLDVRIRLVENFSKIAVHVLALMLAGSLVMLVQNGPDVYFREGRLGLTPNSVGVLFIIEQLLWFLFCLVFAYKPKLVTFRSLTFQYVVMSFWWAATALPVVMPVLKVHTRHIITVSYLPRTVAAFVVGSSRVSGVCNVVIGALMCCYFVILPGDGPKISETVIREVLCTTIIVYSSVCFDRWACARARSAMDTKSMAMSQATVLRILFAMCDAVVTLGQDLRVSQRAPKLANLLRQNEKKTATEDVASRKALVGVNFVDLLAETDAVRFLNFVARGSTTVEEPSGDPIPAEALNVHLRNCSGLCRQVQLFHSQFRDSDDQVGHFIAICEIGEIQTEGPTGSLGPVAGQRGSVGSSRSAATGRRHTTTDSGRDWSRETRSGGLAGSTRGSAGDAISSIGCIEDESEQSWFGDSVSVRAQNKSQDDTLAPLPTRSGSEDRMRGRVPQMGEVEMCFDTLRFKVCHHRSNVAALDVSLMDREGLLRWISEWPSCRAWMQDFVNAILRPVGPNTWPAAACPPSQAGFHMSFRARCSLPPDFLTRQGVPVEGATQTAVLTRVPVEKVTFNPKLYTRRKDSSSKNSGSLSSRVHRSGEAGEVVPPTLAGSGGSLGRPPSTVGRLRRNVTPASLSQENRGVLARREDGSSSGVLGDQVATPLPKVAELGEKHVAL
eukprot:TRINITY_DN63941_c0_g1_i1.p1 TRINITY_DN63941_c0_g1~~TRINITY_DN63941_c0_g1_i1.p1  ORF type:complete len:740 (-),score=93.91 TRINITY_DN63941_c0_g1_i1:47-2266(-)